MVGAGQRGDAAPADVPALLATVPLFQNLRPHHLGTLAAAAVVRVAGAGTRIAIAGRPSPGLIVIGRGTVLRAGRLLGPESCIDELAALDARNAEESATASDDVEYVVLPARAVHDVVRATPELGVALLREASRRFVVPGEEDGPQLMRYALDVREAFREGERRQAALKDTALGSVRALVDLAELKHPWMRGHAARAARTVRLLVESLGLDEESANAAALGGLLHDAGYVVIDAAILRKGERLTEAERVQIQQHPEVGARILEHIDSLRPAVPYVLHHHERIDGRGYPSGLPGKAIPLPGRIMAVVETYESLRMTRPHRDALETRDTILRELRSQGGTQLDRDIVHALAALVESGAIDG